MTLPPEKVNELKQVIHKHLSELDVHGQIRNVLSESLRENETADENNLLEMLKDRGIVDDIMKTLQFEGIEKKSKAVSSKDGSKILKEKAGAWIPDEQKKCKIYIIEHVYNQEVMGSNHTHTYIYIYIKFVWFGQMVIPKSIALLTTFLLKNV